MIRVVVAEDHTMVREALVWLFRRSRRIDVVGEGANGVDAITLTKRHRPDVLVLDLTMPEKDGFQVLLELGPVLHLSATKALVLTMHDDEVHGVRALEAGARGFVHKSASPAQLMTAIERVHRGEKVAPPAILAALATGNDHPADVLSPREFQVMLHLAAGKNHHEIGASLAISLKTVDTHRGHVLKKLRLRNNSDLTRFVVANRLMPV